MLSHRELLEYVTLGQQAANMASPVPEKAPRGHLYFQDLCCCMWVYAGNLQNAACQYCRHNTKTQHTDFDSLS